MFVELKIFPRPNYAIIICLLLFLISSPNVLHGIIQVGTCSDGSPAVLPCDQDTKICAGNPRMGCERHGPAYFCCGMLPDNGNTQLQSISMPMQNMPSGNSQQNCDDKFKQCEHWARRGLCLMDMYKSETKAKLCPKSCKLCHLVPPKETSGGQGAQGPPPIHPEAPKPPPNAVVNANPNGQQPNAAIKGELADPSIPNPPKGINGIDPPKNGPSIGNLPQSTNPSTKMPMPSLSSTIPSNSPTPSITPAPGLLSSIWNKLTGGNGSANSSSNPSTPSTIPPKSSTNSMPTKTTMAAKNGHFGASNTVDPSWYDGFDMDEAKKMMNGSWDEIDTAKLEEKIESRKMASTTISTNTPFKRSTNAPTVDPSWYDGFDMDEAKKMMNGSWDEMDTAKLGEKVESRNVRSTPATASTNVPSKMTTNAPTVDPSLYDGFDMDEAKKMMNGSWDEMDTAKLAEKIERNSPPPLPMPPSSTQMPILSSSPPPTSTESIGLLGSIWEKLTGNKASANANSPSTKPPSSTTMTMDPAWYEDDMGDRLNGQDWNWENDGIQGGNGNSAAKAANSTMPGASSSTNSFPPSSSPSMPFNNGSTAIVPKIPRKMGAKKPRKLSPEQGELKNEENEVKKRRKKNEKNEGKIEKKKEGKKKKTGRKKKNKNERKGKKNELNGKRKKMDERKNEYFEDSEDYSSQSGNYYDYEGSYSEEEEEEEMENEDRSNYWDQFRRGMHGVRDGVKKATKTKTNVDWGQFKERMHSLRGNGRK